MPERFPGLVNTFGKPAGVLPDNATSLLVSQFDRCLLHARMLTGETLGLAMSICLSSMTCSFLKSHTGPGEGGGGKERTGSAAMSDGMHPQGQNVDQDPAQPGCGTRRRD